MRLGVKAQWRDADAMAALAKSEGADTLEVTLHPRDLGDDRAAAVATFKPLASEFALVVHQPERVAPPGSTADFFLNAAARHETWRRLSVDALVGAAAFTREVGARALVLHPGAVEGAGLPPLSSAEALARSLDDLRGRAPDVPLWLENMPWFYGFRDGRIGRCGLGRSPAELEPFRKKVDGFCLDFCHAFLAAPPPGGGWGAVEGFLDAWGGDVRHAHASGALRLPESDPNPRRGEGLPFGEGEMDAATYARLLASLPADAAVVPEIDNGFAAGGRGFRDGLVWLKTALG